MDRRLHLGTEEPVHNMSVQRQQRENDANRGDGAVIPAQLRWATHHSRGNKDTKPHRD